jgi:hypothetical protein
MRRVARRAAASWLAAAAITAPRAAAQAPPALAYDVRFEVRLVPTEKTAHVALHLADPARAVYRLRFRADPERQVAFRGDGKIESVAEPATPPDARARDANGAELVTWTPPRGGGVLRWAVRVDHLRDESSYDARATRDWALVRADDLVPPVHAVTEKGSQSRARLQLALPQGWSAVVPYAPLPDGTWSVDRPERRFDRPVGWLLMGRLGVLRERVAGVRVAIAAPVGHQMRREDVLALLRWTLPTLRKVAPLPERLAIVGAADPMWRGGLSGPNSIYLHAELPLVQPNATSPVLHEVMHTVLRARAGENGDWIVEGLAELYSQELLVRSKSISRRRAERGAARMAEKGRNVKTLAVARADAAVAARGATLLRELDAELRRVSGGQKSLDDVVRALAEARQSISLAHFRAVSERVAGQTLPAFFDRPELVN